MTVRTQLVDARNVDQILPALLTGISKASFTGFDIETEDSRAHEGIKKFRKSDSARVFDHRRTTVCGASLYFDGDDIAYYLNLAHADVENRLSPEILKQVLKAKNPEGHLLCHNAPFELTMMRESLGVQLTDVICTMQMAVSAYGPDDYSITNFFGAGLGEIKGLMPKASQLFHNYEPGLDLNAEQAELLYKVVSKSSKAAHSYNGFVKEIAYGYGLKKLVKSFFGYKMTTFEEVLGDREHMGQLTGEETAAYGADDAYWAVRTFHRLLQFMAETNPASIKAFFDQENPMIYVFSDIWSTGMRVNFPNIQRRRDTERAAAAKVLRELRNNIRALLPFPEKPHEKLIKYDKWFEKNWKSYRERIEHWALDVPNVDDDREQCLQTSGAVPSGWLEDKIKLTGPNFTHYMVMRTILYDLLGMGMILGDGKTQSDGDARGKMLERLKGQQPHTAIIEGINALAGIEQRMKLYLTPYNLLTDPETGRMYPTVNSLLATRRMASANPNGMQLAKNGESTYIRGFFEPDDPDDHVLVSLDWRQIELVEIGEFSGDPEFAKAYGQLPYQDLHLGAAADILSAIYDVEVTEEMFASLKGMPDDVEAPFGFSLVDSTGKRLTPKEAYKYNRGTPGGKGANFGYWYSGSLNSVATARGVGADLMWKMTEKYRDRFAIAEKWRVDTIAFGQENGYVQLPDGHRRNRFEATPQWARLMRQRFDMFGQGGVRFGELIIKKVSRRACNQLINGLIQGTCATLNKRSTQRLLKKIKDDGYRATYKLPIHDELVWSVHKSEVVPFIKMAKGIMCDHPDIIKNLKMDASASIGFTFEPWHAVKAPTGQIEIDEAPAMECLPKETKDKALNDNEIEVVIDWIGRRRRAA